MIVKSSLATRKKGVYNFRTMLYLSAEQGITPILYGILVKTTLHDLTNRLKLLLLSQTSFEIL